MKRPPVSTQTKVSMVSYSETLPVQAGTTPRQAAEELPHEQGVFSWSPQKACVFGTPLVRALAAEAMERFLPQLTANYPGRHPVVDVRVQRLMPGMYPSIPGWHCDAWPRSDYYGQPDPEHGLREDAHVVCTLSSEPGGVSNTEWLTGPQEVQIDKSSPVWQQVHRQIEAFGAETTSTPDNLWVKFGFNAAHRAAPAKRRGWRLFFRMSMMPNKPQSGPPKLSEQVYLISDENGW